MKSYLLGIWNIIDPIYYSCTRLHYIPDSEKGNTLLRVRLTRYKGIPVTLSDGTVIHKNDLLLKIHLHNAKMINELNRIHGDLKRAVYIYHTIKKALPKLLAYLRQHPRYKDIKAIIGITSLYKGAERLGFDIVSIRSRSYKVYKKITFMLIDLIAGNKRHEEPAYLFLSKDKLNAVYGPELST